MNPASVSGQDWTPSPVSDHAVPWPPDAAADYVAKGYWAGVPLGTLLRRAADRHPDRVALIDADADLRLTYAELASRADAAAARLLGLGLRRGHRIVVQLASGWEFVALTMACLRTGIVPVMALPAHRHSELSYLAQHSEASAIAVPSELRGFDHQALAHDLAADVTSVTGGPWHVLVAGDAGTLRDDSVDLRALCGPGDGGPFEASPPGGRDVALFLLSGGTTGLPKLIARTHDDYACNAIQSAK
ncbi:MAG: AMP-binding protein, partial [Streptosporangiales bacterium]|nr:AMP-binding protein [Streptosporangiales bacterium]